jgi:uncharacterized protein YkwD
VAEINLARANPRAYAQRLRDGRDSLDPDEAIDFLERQRPVPPLAYDPRLGAAADRHAADQGPRGQDSHVGSDGSRASQRMQAAGVWSSIYAEVISIAETNPTGVVRQLIIDYGHPDHPHRADLFDPMLRFAGAGCGPNRRYGTMCVIDLTAPPPR